MTISVTFPVNNLATRPKRQTQDTNGLWWTTSGDSTYLPTPSDSSNVVPTATPLPTSTNSPAIPPTSIPGPSSPPSSLPASINSAPTSLSSSSDNTTTSTSTVPVTITELSTTFTSLSQTIVTSTRSPSALPESQTAASNLRVDPVCIGDGLDASSIGLISVVVLPTAIGLLLWLLFAFIRPRYRQVYGLREWFVNQNLRPKPLSRSFWAFLFPPVPLVPPVPSDVSDTGKSAAKDAELYPSDEQLSQRTLWICLLIVLGWAILSLLGFLPLYMVSTPCLAQSIQPSRFTGAYSSLQDMSILRLLQLLDNSSTTRSSNIVLPLESREIVDGKDYGSIAKSRLIIVTVFAIVLALLPVLWKILREFNRLVAYRRRWIDVRCEGLEMGWLSARQAPGFVGWGEKRMKDFMVKVGLSSALDTTEGRNGNGSSRSRRRRRNQDWSSEEKASLEVDVQSLFSIGDTTQLALLIEERDEILENLEIAETKYITSFKLSTPDPSIADFVPVPATPPQSPSSTPSKPQISRPRPLGGSVNRPRRRRGRNPAFGSSSLPPPTSFVMPSQYYKLRGLQGVSGGHFTDDDPSPRVEPSLSDSIDRRVVGSRFQEVNRDSVAFGRIPMGSQIIVESNGETVPIQNSPIPAAALWGPNGGHTSWDTTAFNENVSAHQWFTEQSIIPEEGQDEDWVDVLSEDPEAFEHGEEYTEESLSRVRPRPPRVRNAGTPDESRRETFPLRNKNKVNEEQPPPHLRLQPRQPFVRPLSGLDHDDLGEIYNNISLWRSKLKAINTEIADLQRDCYNDIADGARIKGWIMIGRGLHHIQGVQLIEGRAKEDIRWDELQNEGAFGRGLSFYTIIAMISIFLGIALTAVAGLSIASAPEVAHYFPFLEPLASGNDFGAGLATCLAAALAFSLFVSIALVAVHYCGGLTSSVSVSGSQLIIFKSIFYVLTLVAGVWLFAIGAILFTMGAFNLNAKESQTVANGAIYMSAFAMVLIVNIAVIFPALLLLQPARLWRVLQEEKAAITPRQRFRAVYPRTYNPSYAIGCCVFAVLLASAFSLIFPLLAPAAVILLLLTLIAHRYLIGYVYGRTHSQTGGLLQIWLLKRLGTILAIQPLLLGLILLTRNLWIEGGILCGVAVLVVLIVEIYCTWKTRLPGKNSLSMITRDCLDSFTRTARPKTPRDVDEESTSLVSSSRNTRARGSFASVLDMMSLTLAVMPSSAQVRGPVPLETETLDDLTATERAARTHPDAPPHLPPLPFADHAEEMSGILYAPELLAPPPVIWLPNDVGGIGRQEAYDLQRYHNLQVTLDVRAKDDVLPRRSWGSQTRNRIVS
ncbi:hypothetical protein C8Q75DRAFT_777072 [Abortiporus biennis]|nr:hypothetical protein C8Q75DRAFT_777072 [Abortiporus biennis]